MLTTSRSSRFKRDVKRIAAGRNGKELHGILAEALSFLLAGEILPARYKDHPLSGEYQDCRECHLKPDLLLIYSEIDDETFHMVRLGSHSELFKK